MTSIIGAAQAAIRLGVTEDCDDDEKTVREVIAGASLFVATVAPVWGILYAAFGEPWSGLIPTIYSVVTAFSFLALHRWGIWPLFRTTQLVLIFVLPLALMISLGGYVLGSAVMIWAVAAPLGALWGGRSKEATVWVMLFLAGAVICGILDPLLRDSNDLPDALITLLFVMNITFVMSLVFLQLIFFVGQKDRLIAVMRRNRELESAYLAREVAFRRNDKLATLGQLSAGMAHELNNPTAAAQQATIELATLLGDEAQMDAERASLDLLEDERRLFDHYIERIDNRVGHPEFLDPLDRSDREHSMQDELERIGVDEAWNLAAPLVGVGLTPEDVQALADETRQEKLGPLVNMLAVHCRRQTLLGSLNESTDRIIELVLALKTYTYLDQAPRQSIDVHEGLESTLVMMRSRLRTGVVVNRSYADDLPEIEAYGGELNQVWTNLIGNAIDAMNGQGVIDIETRRVGEAVEVDITDNGPGVPPQIIDEIFDPFVTTKVQGEGTGLGLNISHNIVTEKHGGDILLSSVPGRTRFTIILPIVAPAEKHIPVPDPLEDHDLPLTSAGKD